MAPQDPAPNPNLNPPATPAQPITPSQPVTPPQPLVPIQPSAPPQPIAPPPADAPQPSALPPAGPTVQPQAFVGSFDPIPNTATGIVSAPVTQATPLGSPPARRQALKPLLIGLLAVLVIGGASAAAYVGVVVPNKPANLLRTALINSLQAQQSSSRGTLSASTGAVKATFTTAENSATKAADINLNITASGVDFPIEARLVKQNAYIKIGDLSTISSLIGLYSPDAAQTAQSLSKQVSNKWISIDSTLIDQDPTLKCLLSTNWTLSKADISQLQTQYKQHPFTTIQSATSSTVGSQKAEKFVLNISQNNLNKFGDSLKSLPIVKTINKCPGLNNASTSAMKLTANKVSTQTIPLTIWVDKATKHIAQIGYSSKDVSTVITMHYGPVTITAPSGATPVLQFISTLQSSLGANGAGLSQLLGSGASSGSTPTAPTGTGSATKDAKRRSDVTATQTQVEAFFSEQGYYPSLADMNSASWLSQNMPSLDTAALQDPDGSSKALADKPSAHAYAYQPTGDSGGSCETDDTQCTQYTLTATLSDGSTAIKQSLN